MIKTKKLTPPDIIKTTTIKNFLDSKTHFRVSEEAVAIAKMYIEKWLTEFAQKGEMFSHHANKVTIRQNDALLTLSVMNIDVEKLGYNPAEEEDADTKR